MNGFRAFGKGLPDVGQVINTVEGFEEYLTSHSHIWNERYVKDNIISVVLFVCESGKDQPGHDSFAKQFSKAHPEISVCYCYYQIAYSDCLEFLSDNSIVYLSQPDFSV